MSVSLHLAVIEWAALGWLGASAAIVVPIALHLRGRIVGPPVRFGAIRFVRNAQVAFVRRTRLRDRLLLFTRCAVIILLAATFARPSWSRKPDPNVGHIANATDVVIVWDVSASMSCFGRDGNTLHDNARRDVIGIIESLNPSTHRAAVILAGVRPTLILPELSFNHAAIVTRVRACEPTLEHADLVAAVRRAMAMSSGVAVHVVCDNQGTQLDALAREWPEASSRPYRIHALRHRASNFNVAVHDPVQSPLEIEPGGVWSLGVTVSRSGAVSDVASIVATLAVDDVELHREVKFDRETDRGVVHFEHRFARPGVYAYDVRIVSDDAMLADNRVSGHAFVPTTRRVGVVTDRDPRSSAIRFLTYAIAPDDDVSWSWAWLDAARLDDAAFDQELDTTDTVIVIDSSTLTDAHLSALYRFVDAGGGLLWWLDSAATIDTLDRFHRLDGTQFLSPVSLTQRGPGEQRRWSDVDPSISILPGFDTLSEPAIRAVQVRAAGSVQPNANAHSLISDDRGEAAVTWASLGSGRVFVCNGSFDPDLGATLVRQPVFPALVQGMMRFLLPDPIEAPVHAIGAVASSDQPAALIETRHDTDPEVLHARATIQVDPRESNLDSGVTDWEDGEFANGAEPNGPVAQVAMVAPALPRAVPLWPWCLALCLAFFTVESMLVARRARRGALEGSPS